MKIPTSASLEPQMTTSRERDAELAMLAITIQLNPEELENFLISYNIPRPEYDRLCEKYSLVLSKYKEQLSEESSL